MSSVNNAIYERQCEKWHHDLLNEFEENNTSNLMERLNKIEYVVNKECNNYSLDQNGFKIGDKQRQKLLTLYNKDLREHTIVSHNKCTNEIKNVNEYKQKARNKLNRWKPKVFGDHVLYQIIFINVYNYCYEVGRSYNYNKCQWDDTDIKNLFITIFCKLLDAKIRFKKTRDVPLILSTVFSTNTRFRRSCIYFLEHFNESISWNLKSGKKAADKAYSFQKCLQKIFNYQNIYIPSPIIMNYMDITENNRRCDVYYISVIKKYIIKSEQDSYIYYNNKISNSDIFNRIITEINSYLNDTMSFWSATPRKLTRSFNTNFQYNNDDDRDINIPNFIQNIPSVINTNFPITTTIFKINNQSIPMYNINRNTNTSNISDAPRMINNISGVSNVSNVSSYTSGYDTISSMNDSSRSIPGYIHSDSSRSIINMNNSNNSNNLNNNMNDRSISYDTSNQSYTHFSSLSRNTSLGSSILDDEIRIPDFPGLPMLNDTDNLHPINSGESMHYDNIQTFNPNVVNQYKFMEVENGNLYDNSQPQINYNNMNNAPQLVNQLPPPIRNENNYAQINPHINQYMPPPVNSNNTNNNINTINNNNYTVNNYNYNNNVTINANNYMVNNNNNMVNNNNNNNNTNNNNFNFNNNYDYTYTMNNKYRAQNDIMQFIDTNNTFDNSMHNVTNYDNAMANSTPIEYEYNNMNNMNLDSTPNSIINDTCNIISNDNQLHTPTHTQLEQTINTMNYNYNTNHYPSQMNYSQI